MSPFLGFQFQSSFNDKTPFPGAKAMLTCYVPAGLVLFETFKKRILALFNVLCSDKIKLC